ncbi:protein-ER retention protein [Actinomortierella ambigua]|nr:protein-ER retention protein [Actinomortierella ambigua]
MDIGNIFEEWDFSGSVPLPYRVLLMGCIGIFAWATNLHLLAYLRVDVPALLFSHPPLPAHLLRRPPPRPSGRGDSDLSISTNNNSSSGGGGGSGASGGAGGSTGGSSGSGSSSNTSKYSFTPPASLMLLYRATYMLGVAFLAMTLINMSMYKWAIADPATGSTVASISGGAKGAGAGGAAAAPPATTTTPTRGGIGRDGNPRTGILVPIFGYMTILTMLFIPFNILFIKERYRFLRSMKKVCLSGFNTSVTFSDVILADILTSFARVLGDLAVALCMMFWAGRGSGGKGGNTDNCYNSLLVPIMTSIPYFIRLRQCLTEYKDSHYKVRRHLMNALKYASALFFVALNSFYSFYWDIKHDWMLIERVPGGANNAGYINGYPVSPSPPPVYKETAPGNNMATTTAKANFIAMTPTSKAAMMSASGMPLSPKLSPSTANPTITNSSNSSSTGAGTGSANSNLSTQGGAMNPFASSSSSSSSLLSPNHPHAAHHYFGGSNVGKRVGGNYPTLMLMSPRPWWPWFQQRSGLSQFRMRGYLHYEEAYFYVFAIVLDFLLRTTWMMKVFGNIQIEEYEGGVFTMECLEVLRRWVWVLFRLEAEMVKRQAPSSPSVDSTAFFVGGGGGVITGEEDLYGYVHHNHHHHHYPPHHRYYLDNESIPMTMTNLSSTTLVSGASLSASSSMSSATIGSDLDSKLEKGSGGAGGAHIAMAELKGDR